MLSRNDDRVSGEFLTASAAHAPRSTSIKFSSVPARLSYAATEIEAITQAAPAGTTLLASGFDASRTQVMSMPIGDYQIVHFGTHAFLNSQQPESSGMLLSMVDQNGVEQDGVMSLHDIYNLDLNADLTV